MAIHSSILAWRTPWTEKPDGLQTWGGKESDTNEWLTHSVLSTQLVALPAFFNFTSLACVTPVFGLHTRTRVVALLWGQKDEAAKKLGYPLQSGLGWRSQGREGSDSYWGTRTGCTQRAEVGWDRGLKPQEGRPERSLAESQASQQFPHPRALESVEQNGVSSSCLGPGMQACWEPTIPPGNPAGRLSRSRFPTTHSRFWNSFAFSMIQHMLAIWPLVPLPFLNPAWASGVINIHCEHPLDHSQSKRVPEKHILLLYWLYQSLWLCGSPQNGKLLKSWEYQTTLPDSWEISMQVKKQQLELDMEQHTGFK